MLLFTSMKNVDFTVRCVSNVDDLL